jgi:hypothetical protein
MWKNLGVPFQLLRITALYSRAMTVWKVPVIIFESKDCLQYHTIHYHYVMNSHTLNYFRLHPPFSNFSSSANQAPHAT